MLKVLNLFLLLISFISFEYAYTNNFPLYQAYETESSSEDDSDSDVWDDWSWDESDTEDNCYLE